jgi:hypothetical protein
MSGKKSRDKGKRGERMFRDVLRDEGFAADRGLQFRGGPNSPDVTWDGPPIHWEVKFGMSPRLMSALQQADRDRGEDKMPAAACKKDGDPWTITLYAKDFFRLLREDYPSEAVPTETSG